MCNIRHRKVRIMNDSGDHRDDRRDNESDCFSVQTVPYVSPILEPSGGLPHQFSVSATIDRLDARGTPADRCLLIAVNLRSKEWLGALIEK